MASHQRDGGGAALAGVTCVSGGSACRLFFTSLTPSTPRATDSIWLLSWALWTGPASVTTPLVTLTETLVIVEALTCEASFVLICVAIFASLACPSRLWLGRQASARMSAALRTATGRFFMVPSAGKRAIDVPSEGVDSRQSTGRSSR